MPTDKQHRESVAMEKSNLKQREQTHLLLSSFQMLLLLQHLCRRHPKILGPKFSPSHQIPVTKTLATLLNNQITPLNFSLNTSTNSVSLYTQQSNRKIDKTNNFLQCKRRKIKKILNSSKKNPFTFCVKMEERIPI